MLVAFDLDDTLYLERDYVRSGFAAIGRHLETRGIPGFEALAWRLFEEGVRDRPIDRALEALGRPANSGDVADLLEVYRGHDPGISLLPDARECLARLQGAHLLGLVTDGRPDGQRRKIRALGLDRLIGRIVVTGDGIAPKPSTAPFERLSPRGPAVYVGDNPAKDFQGPRALGWRTVRIRRPGGLWSAAPDLPGSPPDATVEELRGLPDWLVQLR